MNIKILGYNICRAMDAKGVSMLELSRRTKLDRSNLIKRICDPEKMKISMLIKIANAIGVSWTELMKGVDE